MSIPHGEVDEMMSIPVVRSGAETDADAGCEAEVDGEICEPLEAFTKKLEKELDDEMETAEKKLGLDEEIEDLERVVQQIMKGNAIKPDVDAYLSTVASIEHSVRNCSKCRKLGCESCTYKHALRYVVRHAKPASWWKHTSQAAVLGTARMLSTTACSNVVEEDTAVGQHLSSIP